MTSGADEYSASAEYLHLLSIPLWTELRPRVTAALRAVDPDGGPVLELGAGTGLGTEVLLDTVPNPVIAAEPSAALRAVLLARLADRDLARVTVEPRGAAGIPLPDRLSAVVGLHMVGHLPPAERIPLWTAVASRLTRGAPVVLNVQPPPTATAVPAFPWSGVTLGDLTYEATGHAEPAGPDSVIWHMAYRTRRGDEVLTTATAEYRWWVATADELGAELAAAGLRATVDGDLVVAHAPPAI